MRKITYYYEYFEPHRVFYTINHYGNKGYFNNFQFDRIWCQGDQGGVRIVSENWMNKKYENGEKIFYGRKYVTRNENAMKEFAWAKLRAQPFERSK